MLFKGFEICCPICHGELYDYYNEENQRIFRCDQCRQDYPVIFDIPDLRIFPDPYIGIEEDRKKGLRVADKFDDFDFTGLIDYYYSITPVVPEKHAKQYKRGLLAARARAEASLLAFEKDTNINGHFNNRFLLEIGCGTAPFLTAGAKRFQKLIGIDISFRWLVVAKKRLTEAGVDVPVICACAEALPFPDETFDYLIAESTIENVADQSRVFNECQRVMQAEGHIFVSTPNRFSLGPDPHTGIWGGGFLPAFLVNAYVRRQGGIPPKRNFLSIRSLKRLLSGTGFTNIKMRLPDVPTAQRNQFPTHIRILVDIYLLLKSFVLTRLLLLMIGPLLTAVASRPESKKLFSPVIVNEPESGTNL